MRSVTWLILALLGTACSSSGVEMPREFAAMGVDEIGCVVDYGGVTFDIGPLEPGSVETIEPNDYTSFRVGHTPDTVVLVAERERSSVSTEAETSGLPSGGTGLLVGSGAFQDTGNPGFEVRCWQGAG